MKKGLLLIVVLAMLLTLVACGVKGNGASTDASASKNGKDASASEHTTKIALCLTGPANDGAWSSYAYNAVMDAKKEFGIEVLYTENVKPTDMEAVFADYAAQGCDLIIGHGFAFGDAALAVGALYPDVSFTIIDGSVEAENVASYNLSTQERGYVYGVMAAMMSESGKVGFVAGVEGPAIIKVAEAFKLGAKATDPDIEAMTAYTGSFDDAAKSKEAAQAMIDKGADFLVGVANQSNVGMIKACEENGIYCIGELDQQKLAPNNVVMCSLSDIRQLVYIAVQEVLNGNFEGGIHDYGLAAGVLGFTDYGELEDKIPQDVKDAVAKTIEDIKSGALKVPKIEEITPD